VCPYGAGKPSRYLRAAPSPNCSEHLPRRKAGFIGREADVERCELGWLAGASQRRLGAKFGKSCTCCPPVTCKGVQTGPGAAALTRMPLLRVVWPSLW
jgi:hypothetical protein